MIYMIEAKVDEKRGYGRGYNRDADTTRIFPQLIILLNGHLHLLVIAHGFEPFKVFLQIFVFLLENVHVLQF